MSYIDIALALIILFGAFRGYREGFLMEVISFLAIILGILGAFKLLGSAMIMLGYNFHINKSVLPYVAFAVVFIIIVVLVYLLGRMIKESIDKSFLGRVDQAAGAFIGMVKVTFLASVLFWIIDSLSIHFPEQWTEDSWLYPFTARVAPKVTTWIGELIPAVSDIFNRM